MNTMIIVRFDLAIEADHTADRFILRAILPAVPDVGEGVNLKGYPYTVVQRGWSVSDDIEPTLFAFVRVVARF